MQGGSNNSRRASGRRCRGRALASQRRVAPIHRLAAMRCNQSFTRRFSAGSPAGFPAKPRIAGLLSTHGHCPPPPVPDRRPNPVAPVSDARPLQRLGDFAALRVALNAGRPRELFGDPARRLVGDGVHLPAGRYANSRSESPVVTGFKAQLRMPLQAGVISCCANRRPLSRSSAAV